MSSFYHGGTWSPDDSVEPGDEILTNFGRLTVVEADLDRDGFPVGYARGVDGAEHSFAVSHLTNGFKSFPG